MGSMIYIYIYHLSFLPPLLSLSLSLSFLLVSLLLFQSKISLTLTCTISIQFFMLHAADPVHNVLPHTELFLLVSACWSQIRTQFLNALNNWGLSRNTGFTRWSRKVKATKSGLNDHTVLKCSFKMLQEKGFTHWTRQDIGTFRRTRMNQPVVCSSRAKTTTKIQGSWAERKCVRTKSEASSSTDASLPC